MDCDGWQMRLWVVVVVAVAVAMAVVVVVSYGNCYGLDGGVTGFKMLFISIILMFYMQK